MVFGTIDSGAHESSGQVVAPTSAGAVTPWYAVWTRSHCERLVTDQLAAKGFSAFLPEMDVWSKRSGPSRLVRVPMFPGYLFLRHAIEKRSYIEILKARGVVRILEGGWTRLTAIPSDEVEAIQRVVEAGVPVFPHPYLRHGDRARVRCGALTGLEGTFIQDKSRKGRLVLSIELLGRSVAVEVDGADVTPCSTFRSH